MLEGAGLEGKGVQDKPPVEDEPPVEVRAFETYLNFWGRCNTKSDQEMKELEALNAQLKALNAVLTPLGTLDSTIGDKRDNAALIKALDARPDLLYAVNAAMKEAGLKLFPKTEPNQSGVSYEHFGLAQPPAQSGAGDAKMPADLMPHLSKWAVKEQMTLGAPPWNPRYRAVIENLIGPQPDDPKKVTSGTWDRLAKMICPPVYPSEIPMREFNRFSFVYLPSEGDKLPGLQIGGKDVRINPRSQLSWQDLRDTCIDVGNRYRQGLDWEMSLRAFGGLNKTFDGPAVYKALQEVKAKISDVSNQLQAKSVDVNAALQKTSAAMNAVVELINRLFGALGKVLA